MEEKEINKANIEGLEEISEISIVEGENKAEDGSGERHHHRHHHSHHHSHRRRSRSSNTQKKKQNKFVKFFKKNRSIIINIVACSVSVILIIIMAISNDRKATVQTEGTNTTTITQSMVGVEATIFNEKVSLVNQAVLYYVDENNSKTAAEVYRNCAGAKQKLDAGLPLKYSYNVFGLPSGVEIDHVQFELSESGDFDDAKRYSFDKDSQVIDIYHLKTGTEYFYRLNIALSSGDTIGTTGNFETEQSPRMLAVDGAVNVRDIGGWMTDSGKRIRQGLLYRGSELDGLEVPEYTITEKGIWDMRGVLGVRFDMDLRLRDTSEKLVSALGADVEYKFYSINQYANIFNQFDGEKIRGIFADLADADNYPMYLHCTYGRDRTGTVCYLLEALLGVSDKDLRRDYELSAFTYSSVDTEEFTKLIVAIGMYEGNNTREKVEGYLLSIGVTAEEIASIRNIFLGE